MARPLRIDIEDGWYHVMNRGADHGAVFLDDSDRIEFGTRLADIHDRFGIETHAYCLMDTHYHLLLHCPHGRLSSSMQRFGSLYTRHVNDRLGRDGPLFRGRFHSKPIVHDRYLLAATRYIHRNALDVRGVDSVEQYRWSSHRTYLGLRGRPAWLRTDTVLSGFGGDAAAFGEFVSADLGPSATCRRVRSDLAAVLDAANLVVIELGLGDRGRAAAVARSVALGWAEAVGGFDQATVMEVLEIPSPGAMRTAVSRVRRRMLEDSSFAGAIDRSADLAGVATVLRRGSDPWRNSYSAARAAS
jgi:REP element-mobilizing transposase RayT